MIAPASQKPVQPEQLRQAVLFLAELSPEQWKVLCETVMRAEGFVRVTAKQAQRMLNDSPRSFYRKLPARKLTIIRDGGRTFYRSDEVLAIKSKGSKS